MQEEVLRLMCGMLSRVAHLENEAGSLRNRLQEKAVLFGERYSREGYKTSSSMVNSFIKLKDLLTFFDQYHAKQYPQAMKVIYIYYTPIFKNLESGSLLTSGQARWAKRVESNSP